MVKRARAAMPAGPPVYSVADVARLLQVSEATVRQLTHRGRLRRLPIDRPWRYAADEVRRFLAGRPPGEAAAGLGAARSAQAAVGRPTAHRPARAPAVAGGVHWRRSGQPWVGREWARWVAASGVRRGIPSAAAGTRRRGARPVGSRRPEQRGTEP